MSRRQRVRRVILLVSLLLFPVTFYYFSPYLSLAAAAEGAVSGSVIVFGVLFLASLFLGRAFCGWACPVGGLGEICATVQGRPVSRRVNWIKYAIWAPWLGGLGLVAVSAGGFRRLDFLYQTVYGLSLVEPAAYAVYAVVLAVVLALSFAVGRRGFCHAACWMAPFMVVGAKIKSWVNWPSLRLRADAAACARCGQCDRTCPMSLGVSDMVQKGGMVHPECILCGQCADTCPGQAIRLGFRRRG